MAGLPDEITTEILLRLPAKSLVRFRCVSRFWNSLLTSTSFVEAYSDRSSRLGHKYLLKYNRNDSSRNENDYTQSEIFLWNPSTNERRRLPQPRFFVSELIGFGFDPSPSGGCVGDFKVVNIRMEGGFFMSRCSQEEVYSLRRNSWKRISSVFPCGIDPKCSGNQVVFGNFVCWSYQYDASLVLFDLVEEVFHQMVLPSSMRAVTEHISLLDGRLSLIAWKRSCHSREMWIMEEFCAAEPWTKLYTIDLSSTSSSILRYSPLGFAGSRSVLFVKSSSSGERVVSFNVETAQFEELEVEDDSVKSCRLVTYTHSLGFSSEH
ncbi:F-box/kelch-repeat protein At3g06240-like [Rhodamnia argentea]|uniref:F-box/kelch-repeat protein At3g06240-like n=1 Tax=Rhodamnia argentea TaxID=178133 RepID=A0A8B8QV46_9MYRT|nr:F-box/kelch-repeat protein At3g06240-like [Rhodamnia argentea]